MLAQPLAKSGYGQYLLRLLKEVGFSMKATSTAIPDVLILEPKVFGDARGFFFESFNRTDIRGGHRRFDGIRAG
jgi:hypothetical protein